MTPWQRYLKTLTDPNYFKDEEPFYWPKDNDPYPDEEYTLKELLRIANARNPKPVSKRINNRKRKNGSYTVHENNRCQAVIVPKDVHGRPTGPKRQCNRPQYQRGGFCFFHIKWRYAPKDDADGLSKVPVEGSNI